MKEKDKTEFPQEGDPCTVENVGCPICGHVEPHQHDFHEGRDGDLSIIFREPLPLFDEE